MNQNNVLVFKLVARLTPFQFFGQLAIQNDLPQPDKFFLPLAGLVEKEINGWVHIQEF
jgi:hypothetical protein